MLRPDAVICRYLLDITITTDWSHVSDADAQHGLCSGAGIRLMTSVTFYKDILPVLRSTIKETVL